MVNSVINPVFSRSLSFFSLCCLLLSSVAVPPAFCLEGKVEKHHSKKAVSKEPIKGGIKDEAVLNPSLKVLPGRVRRDRGGNFDGNVIQYNGSNAYSPGGMVLQRRREPMRPRQYGRRSHRIPPISDYSLNSRSGIMTFGGHGVIVAPSHHGISSVRRGSGVSIPRSTKGVTVFVPGYEISRSPSPTSSYDSHHYSYRRSYRSRGHRGGNKGISVWAPGLAAVYDLSSQSNSVQSRQGVTAWTPGYEVNSAPSVSHDHVFTPGYSMDKVASKSGVTAWSPGYEVTVSAGGGYKTSLGGKWYDSDPDTNIIALKARPGGVMPDPIFAQPVLEGPLLAKAELLPQLKNTSLTDNITWKDWYRTVASAIYSRWKNFEVGAGTAKVHVVVTRGREISAEVADFYPAALVERNVNEETEFRVAALKAVRAVEKYEIPSFPPLSIKDQVQFNVMLKRTVDGPIGIDISKL